MRHGVSAYRNRACHDGPDGRPCQECRAAGTADTRRRRQALIAGDPDAVEVCHYCGHQFRRVASHELHCEAR